MTISSIEFALSNQDVLKDQKEHKESHCDLIKTYELEEMFLASLVTGGPHEVAHMLLYFMHLGYSCKEREIELQELEGIK